MSSKKVVGMFFFGLIVFSMFGFVSAVNNTTMNNSALFNSLRDSALFGPILDFVGFVSSEGFATFLLGVLVIMMIYSLMSFIPFFGDGPGIKWAASIIIGVLAFLYVDVNTIKILLQTYEALGIVFSAVVPFLVVLAFSVRLETEAKLKNYIFSHILSNLVVWGFVVYILFSLVSGAGGWNSFIKFENVSVFRGVYFFTLVAGLIWSIWKGKFISKAEYTQMQKDIQGYRELQERASAVEDARASATRRRSTHT